LAKGQRVLVLVNVVMDFVSLCVSAGMQGVPSFPHQQFARGIISIVSIAGTGSTTHMGLSRPTWGGLR